jgi:hypothetical protein
VKAHEGRDFRCHSETGTCLSWDITAHSTHRGPIRGFRAALKSIGASGQDFLFGCDEG